MKSKAKSGAVGITGKFSIGAGPEMHYSRRKFPNAKPESPMKKIMTGISLLALAVVLQLVHFLYMRGAIILIAAREPRPEGPYGRGTLWMAGLSGFVTTAIGMGVAFVPPADQSTWLFELKMAAGCVGLLGLGAFFFLFNARRAPSLGEIAHAEVPSQGDAR